MFLEFPNYWKLCVRVVDFSGIFNLQKYVHQHTKPLLAKQCPFDNLANEILDNVISFITKKSNVSWTARSGGLAKSWRWCKSHVNFRVVMLRHQVWHDANFAFDRLVPWCVEQLFERSPNPIARPHFGIRITRLCHVLFSDPACLIMHQRRGRLAVLHPRKSFCCRCLRSILQTVCLLGELIPRWHWHLQSLDCISVNLSTGKMNLSIITFSQIARFLPCLKILSLQLSRSTRGSSKDLEELEEFSITAPDRDISPEILPIGSGKTLTRMIVDSDGFPFECSLEGFSGLKYLPTEPDHHNQTPFLASSAIRRCVSSLRIPPLI